MAPVRWAVIAGEGRAGEDGEGGRERERVPRPICGFNGGHHSTVTNVMGCVPDSTPSVKGQVSSVQDEASTSNAAIET